MSNACSVWVGTLVAALLAGCAAPPPTAPSPEMPAPAASAAQPDGSAPALKVFAETTYHLVIKSMVFSPTNKDAAVLATGTGFVVEHQGRRYVVTAAHVVCGPSQPAKVIDETPTGKKTEYTIGGRTQVTGVTFRVRVSDLALQPVRVYLDPAADLAVLELSESQGALLALRVHRLQTLPPAREQTVRVWGYPSTPTLQLQTELVVSDLNPGFFTLNRPLDPGFSGGPVMSSGGDLLGAAVRSTERQTRCVPTDAIRQALEQFGSAAQPYHDGMAAK